MEVIPIFAILATIVLPLVLVFIFAMTALLTGGKRRNSGRGGGRMTAEEQQALRDLLIKLEAMEQRMNNLETILADRQHTTVGGGAHYE